MLRTDVVRSPNWVDELEGSWKTLVENAPSGTPFQTWEWHASWWKQYAKTKRPLIFCFYEGQDPVGIMPMAVSAAPWRTARTMATGASDYGHPLAREGYEGPVAECLLDALAGMEDVDLVDLQQVRETEPLAWACREAKSLDQATCLVLDLPKTFDQYLGTLNKSLRYDVRKLDKELFKSGRARIETVTADTLGRGLEVFLQTHRQRWRKRGLPGSFVGSRALNFHREWTSLAIKNGWLWLSLLHLDDKPIGAIYALRLGSACYYYQAGFDPAFSSISPGSLLVGHTIRRAIEEGVSTFDFLRGDEPYKRRWKPQHAFRNMRFVIPSPGLWAKAGQAWNIAGGRIEGKVRARLEGKGLL